MVSVIIDDIFEEDDSTFFERVGVMDIGKLLPGVSIKVDPASLFEGKPIEIQDRVFEETRDLFKSFGRLAILSLIIGSETQDWTMKTTIMEMLQEMRKEMINL